MHQTAPGALLVPPPPSPGGKRSCVWAQRGIRGWRAGLSLRPQIFLFLLRTARKDSPQGPPIANHQPPPTTNRQAPTAANHHQPPTVNCHGHSSKLMLCMAAFGLPTVDLRSGEGTFREALFPDAVALASDCCRPIGPRTRPGPAPGGPWLRVWTAGRPLHDWVGNPPPFPA